MKPIRYVPDIKDELITNLEFDIDVLRRACMMAREELEFGGDWQAAKRTIDEALEKTKGAYPFGQT